MKIIGKILKIIIMIISLLCILNNNKIQCISISSKNTSNSKDNNESSIINNLHNQIDSLLKENNLLKQQLLELKGEHKISSVNNQDNSISLGKLDSSFLELQLQTKTDPVFKSIINYSLPRETSFIASPGERNNRMFSHLKLCPPGCLVGGY